MKDLGERAEEARQAARRPGRSRRRAAAGCREPSWSHAAAARPSPRPPGSPHAGRRKADWRRRRLVLGLMSPWIVGFSVFFGYPLVMSAYLSFNHYDLLSPPRWVGLANYHYLFARRPAGLDRGQEHAVWMVAIARAAAGALRVRDRA